MAKPRKKSVTPETLSHPQAADKVYSANSLMLYEIGRVHIGSDE
jgi:hypothetical protein